MSTEAVPPDLTFAELPLLWGDGGKLFRGGSMPSQEDMARALADGVIHDDTAALRSLMLGKPARCAWCMRVIGMPDHECPEQGGAG